MCLPTCVQLERRCENLLVEKENLRTELEELRAKEAAARSSSGSDTSARERDEAAGARRPSRNVRGSPSSPPELIDPDSGAPYPVLARYDPESPAALKRKVRELEAQVRDLIEANESTALVLQSTERELEQVRATTVGGAVGVGMGMGGRASGGGTDLPSEKIISDLRGENRRLRESVDKLRRELLLAEVNAKHPGADAHDLQTPAESNALREKNRALLDDNAALREQLARAKHDRERGSALVNQGAFGGQSRFGLCSAPDPLISHLLRSILVFYSIFEFLIHS